MKNRLFQLIAIAAAFCGALTQAHASYDWSRISRRGVMPKNLFEVQGAFKGVGFASKSDRETAHLIVVPLQEDGQPSGRFNIFILFDYKAGAVFEGYISGDSGARMMLRPVVTDPTEAYLDFPTPVATLVLEQRREGVVIAIRPAFGSKAVLNYDFTKESDDLWIGPVLPTGTYKDGKTEVVSTPLDSQQASFRITNSNIGLAGTFISYFELTGMMVLKSEQITSSGNEYPEDKISAVVVSVVDKNNSGRILMAKPSKDGSNMPVQMVNLLK